MKTGTIRAIDIESEMRGAYLPDARDGLKPVGIAFPASKGPKVQAAAANSG